MENEEKGNIFTRTGRVQDYLAYAGRHEDIQGYAVNHTKDTTVSDVAADGSVREKEL